MMFMKTGLQVTVTALVSPKNPSTNVSNVSELTCMHFTRDLDHD